jgi:hypothetical protein
MRSLDVRKRKRPDPAHFFEVVRKKLGQIEER